MIIDIPFFLDTESVTDKLSFVKKKIIFLLKKLKNNVRYVL